MADTTVTSDTLISAFPHPTLIKITGEPTREEIIELFTQIKANASSVHTTLGGGAHGHLGAVLTAAEYALAIPGVVPYGAPPHPGNQALIANGASAAAIAQANMLHQRRIKVYTGYATMQTALKNQIIAAIEAKYLPYVIATSVSTTSLSYKLSSTSSQNTDKSKEQISQPTSSTSSVWMT